MEDPVAQSNFQKGIIPDTKSVDEAPRRADGVSQLCMSPLTSPGYGFEANMRR